MNVAQDRIYMQRALALAREAERVGEVPVGCVVVFQDKVIGEGHNQPIKAHDPSAHAEIVALRDAASTLKNYRLPKTTLYVTLEPCAMCAAAMVHARVERLVFAATDPKTGAAGSVFNLVNSDQLNHRMQVDHGVCAEESQLLLKHFFQARR